MKEDEMSKKFKKALRIAVNVGCGFEGDAEDAAELLTLITGLESRIAELSQAVGLITTLKPTMVMDVDHPLDMAKEVEAYVTARIADLEALIEKLVDEGCVIAERFSVKGGSEADLEDWENVIDEYKAVMPEVQE